MRFSCYVLDQCAGAVSVIEASRLNDEAKAGLLQTVKSLSNAFRIDGLQQPVRGFLPQLDTALSSFAILASVYTTDTSLLDTDEMKDLLGEIEGVIALIDTLEMDGAVQDVAKRHLHVLLSLLQNVDALGIDAALAAYAELVIRLRRADNNSPVKSRSSVQSLWDKIGAWGEKLVKISGLVNSGTKLLENGSEITHKLLNFIGS